MGPRPLGRQDPRDPREASRKESKGKARKDCCEGVPIGSQIPNILFILQIMVHNTNNGVPAISNCIMNHIVGPLWGKMAPDWSKRESRIATSAPKISVRRGLLIRHPPNTYSRAKMEPIWSRMANYLFQFDCIVYRCRNWFKRVYFNVNASLEAA